MSDDTTLTPAQELHAAGFERLRQQIARGQPADPTHDVGGLELPPLVEGPYRLPPDNIPSQPLEKKYQPENVPGLIAWPPPRGRPRCLPRGG